MIKKVNKIRNLGLVFKDYNRPARLSYFKKANLIYGWNGCGKTTLTRLYDGIGGNPLPGLEYEVEDEAGNKYTQADAYPEKIRIFNQDYIEKNVKILDSRANSISILLGEENKELIEQIEKYQKELQGDPETPDVPGKVSLLKSKRAKAKQDKTLYETKFTDIAKTIGTAMGGNALRTYRRQQADADFKELKGKAELSQDDLDKYLVAVKQESQPVVKKLALRKLVVAGEEKDPTTLLQELSDEAVRLLAQTVEANTIKRLSDNSDISTWVETGIAIHAAHHSAKCEYCRQPIPLSRISDLAKHFNEADRKLKDSLDELLRKLAGVRTIINEIELPDKTRLYGNLQNGFSKDTKGFAAAKTNLLADIKQLETDVRNKKAKTTERINLEPGLRLDELTLVIERANKVIKVHNDTTADFDAVKESATTKLKQHFLSGIFDEVKALKQSKDVAIQEADQLDIEITALNEMITQARAQISSDHKACDHINEKLIMFLGHKELQFQPHIEIEEDEYGQKVKVSRGYDILRGKDLATNLSEGEKTAIAFVYFVVHLGGDDFDVQDGIVVIDDPISSLDSNSLYQAFSFLKNAVADAGQCFILTHNFDFLKLLLNWQQNNNHGSDCGFFMIKNTFDGDDRNAHLELMDKELREHESEYHYLFKTLKQLRDSQDDTIAKAYPIPNIARKVWDTFTMFSVPSGENAYKKIIALKASGYDKDKLDAIYKFINDQSHITGSGFDPALVTGTKRAVAEMLDMIKTISPEHFRIIDESTN